MEFEPRRAEVGFTDEAARLAASARVSKLAPVHDDVVPDDLPDTLVAAQHALAPPIANLPTDSEATPAEHNEIAQARANHRLALTSSIAVVLVLATVVTISLLNR